MTGTFGPTYDPVKDGARISTQMERIRNFALDQSSPLTLGEFKMALEKQHGTIFPEASISAQLRHLKKPRFGSYQLQKRRRDGAGLWEYRLLGPSVSVDHQPSADKSMCQHKWKEIGERHYKCSKCKDEMEV